MNESKAADWLVKGLVVVVAAVIVLPLLAIGLDWAQEPLRKRWTNCFADPTPQQALAQLRLAKSAYARGDMQAAIMLAKRGQSIVETSADPAAFW